MKDNEPTPLGFVRFFDPSSVGINVEKTDSGVKVKDAPKEKPFGAAGLLSGDFIVALDGKEPKDPETFRRLLRPRAVNNEEMLFCIRRGNETLEIKVRVPEEKESPAEKPKER
ncbi:MAG TPA: PDZ domain-containing protein, partial [Gemmataceae bacterium]|nr:PDZ domain-containing protein [Gemmataceae bacterium]